MDRPRLRDVILPKLDDGTLPTQAPNKVHSGYGSGATCGACGDTILRVQVEYELNYPDERRTVRLHLGCARLWEAVRLTRGLDSALVTKRGKP
jgi:hypothetical protein